MSRTLRVALGLGLWICGCSDYQEPGGLRPARVLAVQLTQPRLGPEEKAQVLVLVSNDEGAPSIESPKGVSFLPTSTDGLAPPFDAADVIKQDGANWFIAAPTAEQLAVARQRLKLPPDTSEALAVSLSIAMSFRGRRQVVQKIVRFGMSGNNPTIARATVAGLPLAGAEVRLPTGTHELAAAASGDGKLSFAWFAHGELASYREANATVRFTSGDASAVVLIVRDDGGGVAWQVGQIRAGF